MSTKTPSHCIHHPDRPAVGHCFQCHKPLCEECRYPDADGVFCDQACYDKYVAYQGRRQPPVKSSRLGSVVAGLVVLALLAAAVYVGGGMMKLPVLKSLYEAIARVFGG